jgi:polyphenol oxidase
VLRYQEDFVGARFALTDRAGGISSEPYAELNLARHVGDDAGAVEENRRRLSGRVERPLDRMIFMNQVHGGDVAVVDGPWPASPPEVDALVTRSTAVTLAVLVADCVPVLLADPRAGVVGVAHAGRAGLVANVVGAAVDTMRDLGAHEIVARVGPSVCGRCYEVPEQMRAAVTTVERAAWSTTPAGTPALDVASLRSCSAEGSSSAGSPVAPSRTPRSTPTAGTGRQGALPAWPGSQRDDRNHEQEGRDRRRPRGCR